MHQGAQRPRADLQDRLTKVLVRKDMSRPGHGPRLRDQGALRRRRVPRVPATRRPRNWSPTRSPASSRQYGGNCIGLNGSGQLTMEAQWIENLLMKGVIGSNSIEANARMCMTSAVTGYFHSYGSDTPPTCYDDIEQADIITLLGPQRARGAPDPVLARGRPQEDATTSPPWSPTRAAPAPCTGLEDINPRNCYHFQTLNGDISLPQRDRPRDPDEVPRRRSCPRSGSSSNTDRLAGVHRGHQGALLAAAGGRAAAAASTGAGSPSSRSRRSPSCGPRPRSRAASAAAAAC